MELPDELYREIAQFTDVFTFHRFRKVNRRLFAQLRIDRTKPVLMQDLVNTRCTLFGASWHHPRRQYHFSWSKPSISGNWSAAWIVDNGWLYLAVNIWKGLSPDRIDIRIHVKAGDTKRMSSTLSGNNSGYGEHRTIDNPSWSRLLWFIRTHFAVHQ